MDRTPMDEMLDRQIVELHRLKNSGSFNDAVFDHLHRLALLVDDTRMLARAALNRRDMRRDHEAELARLGVERDIACRERDAFAAEVRNVETITAERIAALLEEFASTSGIPHRSDAYRHAAECIRAGAWRKR